MIGRLDRYVAKVYVASLAATLLACVGLLVVTDQVGKFDDMVDAAEKLERSGVKVEFFRLAARYYAFLVSLRLILFTPFVTFLAATFTAARLQRSNETVAMLASGVSLQRAFAPVFVASMLVAALQLVFRETLLPRLAAEVAELQAIVLKGNARLEIADLWVTDRNGNQIKFESYRPRERAGDGLEAYAIRRDAYRKVSAESARYVRDPGGGGRWELAGGTLVGSDRAPNGSAAPVRVDRLPAEFALSPRDCDVAVRASIDHFHLSLSELDRVARRHPGIPRYQILLHWTITTALANVLLPLLGLPFLLRLARRSTVEGVAIALAICIVYFACSIVCFELGGQAWLGPVAAAWLPPLLFGSLGIALFEAMPT